ncbi:helix-turn-helix transcriptional regulator [Gottfriedia acidiceleris]|uniref:helix-turn-helix transcriptional regulator n=1 Tax=Gottfriedia acidiceleris TaxID=371036 RepID=UPI002F267E25
MALRAKSCLLPHHLRKAKMTQQELANRLGISRQQVNKYCKMDDMMSLRRAVEISHILKNCAPEDLYEWE